MQVRSLGWEDSLEGGHDNPVFLSGESPWTEEPGGLQSKESQRVRHNGATKHTNQFILKLHVVTSLKTVYSNQFI